MSTDHLTGEELDLVLLGEGLPAGRAGHLGECLVCRRRRDELLAVIAAARAADPGPDARARVRAAAIAAAGHRRHARPRWWLAAAAALVLTALVAVFVATRPQPAALDTEAILLEVDEVLARDPLAAFADAEVIEVVAADTAAAATQVPSSS